MRKKKMGMGTILFLVVLIGGGGFGTVYFTKNYFENKNAWKIEITEEYINVREEHTPHSNKLGEVKKGKTYKVEEIYLEDARFVWYKIEFEKNKYGWLSSGRKNPYVKEINNPDGEGKEDYKVDYANPVIKYYEDDYKVLDINSITYEHLTIEDESSYTIKHEIYYEAHPKDRPDPQYWIKYIVTDEFGNTSSKVQRIIFVDPPEPSKVKDFSEIEKQ